MSVRPRPGVQNFLVDKLYKYKNMSTMNEELIIECCKNCKSMAEAARKAKIPHMTFKRYAIKLGIYKPNTAGKGLIKPKQEGKDKFFLKDILEGKHPNYTSGKLRIRLIQEGIKEHKCEKCKLTEWLGIPIPLELNHKDGNKHNHSLKNIELLCPNCHALTPNYRGRNMKTYRGVKIK